MVVKNHPLEPPKDVEVPAGVYVVQVATGPPDHPIKRGFAACDASPPAPAPVTVPVQ
jgi:hypothetical protein